MRGIVAAVIVSVLSLIQQTNDPPVYVVGRKRGPDVFRRLSDEHPTDETLPGRLMVRVEGRVYFGNAQRVSNKLEPLIERAAPKVVVIDCSALTDLEYTALKMLIEAEERARRAGPRTLADHAAAERAWRTGVTSRAHIHSPRCSDTHQRWRSARPPVSAASDHRLS